jgi:hypothetical protein
MSTKVQPFRRAFSLFSIGAPSTMTTSATCDSGTWAPVGVTMGSSRSFCTSSRCSRGKRMLMG